MEFIETSADDNSTGEHIQSDSDSIITAAYTEATTSVFDLQSSQGGHVFPQVGSWPCDRLEPHYSELHPALFQSGDGSWLLEDNNEEHRIHDGTIYRSLELCNQSHVVPQTTGCDPDNDGELDRLLLDPSGRDTNVSSPCSSTSDVSDNNASTPVAESIEYHTRSGVTRPYSKRRSSAMKRNRINKRERERMHKLCDAFEKLRQILPARKTVNGTNENNKKMSKICTLVMAQRYIQALQDMLDSPLTAEPNSGYPDVQFMQQSFLPLNYGYHTQ